MSMYRIRRICPAAGLEFLFFVMGLQRVKFRGGWTFGGRNIKEMFGSTIYAVYPLVLHIDRFDDFVLG